MTNLSGEFTAGAAFGSALAAAGIYSPALIKAQMHLADFTMLKIFIAASASGAIAVHLADRVGFAPIKPRTPSNLGLFQYDGNLIGGALLGTGMALTGACPGTSLVQLAAGLRNGLFVVLGGLAGGISYVTLSRLLRQKREASCASAPNEATPLTKSATVNSANPSNPARLPPSTKCNLNTMLLVWEVFCILAIQLANKFGRIGGDAPGLVGPVMGGCLIGAAQATTVLLTRHTVGVSTAYENLALALLREGPASSPSILFAAGILSGSAVLTRMAPASALGTILSEGAHMSATPALFGGFAMVLGARIAGGCTSGHGISGLVTFSWASFISVAAMFGAGIATAFVLG